MRGAALLLALILPACQGTAGEVLTPDEFHLWGSHTEGDSAGTLGSSRHPGRFETASDGDYNTIGGGFTWYLDRRAHRRDEDSARLLRIALALEGRTPPEPPPTPLPDPDPAPTPSPGPEAAGGEPGAHEHEEPEPDPVNPWQAAGIAGGALASAYASWRGRQRIPYVRDWTSEGRARRAEAAPCEDDDPA